MSRTVQYKKDGEWWGVSWPDVKEGMTIRLFEEDGTQISLISLSGQEHNEFKILGNSYQLAKVWQIDLDI